MHAAAALLQPLLDGRWLDWHGLPAPCSLAALAAACGGSTVLDERAELGEQGRACVLSTLAALPVQVWHEGDGVLRIEHERWDDPAPLGHADMQQAFARLDAVQGLRTVEGGEWVAPARGLSLLVTPGGRVVSAAGFAPTSLAAYLAGLRYRRRLPVPMPRPQGQRP